MNSWWDLGEWSGFDGTKLALFRIACPFCLEKGNFSVAFHAEKKQPNGKKILNFDTLKCGNCASFLQVFWSAGDRVHDYRAIPWPLRIEKYPENWPEAVGRYWLQARRSLSDENWDAAAVMGRSAMQMALRDHNAEGKNLKEEIDNLTSKGILPPIMRDWAHNVRELGNDSAHPKPDQGPTDRRDANDIVQFLDYLLEYLYTLPKRIEAYRARNKEKVDS
jgi:hypothetical protein